MRLLAGLLFLLVTPLLANAQLVEGGFTVKPHTYIWRADGSSATQGSGSIAGWPTRTGGTASCSLSQVTTSPTGTIPPGSGTLIKAFCIAGAAPTSVSIKFQIPPLSIENIGNFGYYFFDPTGDSSAHGGPNIYFATDTTLTKRFHFGCSQTQAQTARRKGWNLCTYQRGDQTTTIGAMTYSDTVTYLQWEFTPQANQTFTIYFGDVIKGWYTKPQILVWAADNGVSGYSTMFAYMNAPGRKVRGSYAPTTQYLPSPVAGQLTISQLQEMQSNGWSIIPHQTIGTALTAMTEEEIITEIETVLSIHQGLGFRTFGYYQPAGGLHNDLSDAVMKRYGLIYGNNANSAQVLYGRQLYGGLLNPYNLWSYTADGQITTTAMLTAINNTIKYGGYLGLLWHGPTVAGEITAFQQTIDYLVRLRDANVLDTPSYEEFFYRLENGRASR